MAAHVVVVMDDRRVPSMVVLMVAWKEAKMYVAMAEQSVVSKDKYMVGQLAVLRVVRLVELKAEMMDVYKAEKRVETMAQKMEFSKDYLMAEKLVA